MKAASWFLFVVLFAAGCATTPDSIKPHPTKYTVQVLKVTTANPEGGAPQLTPEAIDALLADDGTDIHEYPIVRVGIGETAINDQTQSISVLEDFNVVDGEPVAQMKECKLGESVEVSISSVDESFVEYAISVHDLKRAGYDLYKLSEAFEVEIPYFESHGLKSELSQSLSEWVSLGGLQNSKGNMLICIRILPPKSYKPASHHRERGGTE